MMDGLPPNSLNTPFGRYKNEIRGFYDLYFASDASDKIDFPEKIIDELRKSLLVKYKHGVNPFRGVLEK